MRPEMPPIEWEPPLTPSVVVVHHLGDWARAELFDEELRAIEAQGLRDDAPHERPGVWLL